MLRFILRRSFLIPSLLLFSWSASLFSSQAAAGSRAPAPQAPSQASLRGILIDPSQAPISGANVTLQQVPPAPGAAAPPALTVISANDGDFQFAVPPGRYRIAIVHPSFVPQAQDLTLIAGTNPELRISLAIEPLSANVVVSASPEPIPLANSTSPVDIITRQDIDQQQAIQAAPLLEELPGMSLGQTGPAGGVTSLFLDGGQYYYAKVLIDGVSANEPGGAVDFSYFTLDNIDKIEVVHGAQSAIDGSDAMTGTIQLLSHRGTTRLPELRLAGDGGSFDTAHGSAQLSELIHWFDYSVDYGYFSTAGRGVNDGFTNRTISGNFGIRFHPQNTLRLTVRSNASDAGQPGQELFTPPSFDDHNNLHNLTAGAAWNFQTGPHWQYQLTANESDIHQIFQEAFASYYLSPDPFDLCVNFPRLPNAVASPLYCDFPFFDYNQYNRADFQAQASYVIRQFTLTAGYWYEVENAVVGALNEGHVRRNNQAGFVDGHWQPQRRLTINAGFRVEDNSAFTTRVVPRAGVAWLVRDGHDFLGATRLRFAYGAGIKEPRLDQQFGTDPCDPGNPNLLPEQTHSIHAGVEQQLDHDHILLSGDYFDNRFIDMISFNYFPTTTCPDGAVLYFNTDLARARGANISVQSRPARWLRVRGNYTFDDSRVLVSPGATDPVEFPGNHLLRRPENAGSIVLDAPWRRVDANLAVLFVGRRTDSDFLFPPLGLTSNPGYVRFDIAGSFQVTKRLSLIGRVQNLFNKDYTDVLGYPTLGRVAYGGLRLRLGGDE